MKRNPFRTAAVPTVAALVLALSLSACGAGNEKSSDAGVQQRQRKLSGTLNGAGSSAQEAAQGAWTAGFQSANSGATVNYDPSGSGAGVEQFLAGAVNFAGSDAYLDDDQLASSKKPCDGETAIEVPNYISPIALVFNVEGVDKLQLSPDTAAKIFAGKITTWDDAAIKADNPGAKLPSDEDHPGAPLGRLRAPRTTSPTTCTRRRPDAWTDEAVETWPFKSGEGANGTSGVIEAVKNGKDTIGYADASQAGDLGKASIKVGERVRRTDGRRRRQGRRRVQAGAGSRRRRHRPRHRPHHDRGGRLPAGAAVLRDRLPDVQGQEDRGPGQGLPDLRGRAPTARPRRARPRARHRCRARWAATPRARSSTDRRQVAR